MEKSLNKKSRLFGMKLRLLRNKQKMSQEVFCEKVGCTVRALYRWEHGLTYPMPVYRPQIETIIKNIGKV